MTEVDDITVNITKIIEKFIQFIKIIANVIKIYISYIFIFYLAIYKAVFFTFFISWLARSPYLVNDDEFIENTSSHSGFKTFTSFIGDGKLVSWNSWQSFDLEIKYLSHLNKKWQLGAAYLFEFIHSDRGKAVDISVMLNIAGNINMPASKYAKNTDGPV